MPKNIPPKNWNEVYGNPHGEEPIVMTPAEFLQQLKDPKSKVNQQLNNQMAIVMTEQIMLSEMMTQDLLAYIREKELLKQESIERDANSSWSLVTPEMINSYDYHFNHELARLTNDMISCHNAYLALERQYDTLFKESIKARTELFDRQLAICDKAILNRIDRTTDDAYRQQLIEAHKRFQEEQRLEPELRRKDQELVEQALKDGDKDLAQERMRATPNRLQIRYERLFNEMNRNCPEEFKEENQEIINQFRQELKAITTQDKQLQDIQAKMRDLASRVEERKREIDNLKESYAPRSESKRPR